MTTQKLSEETRQYFLTTERISEQLEEAGFDLAYVGHGYCPLCGDGGAIFAVHRIHSADQDVLEGPHRCARCVDEWWSQVGRERYKNKCPQCGQHVPVSAPDGERAYVSHEVRNTYGRLVECSGSREVYAD